MKLYSWRGETTNFGDELNHLLWPALLPDLLDDDDAEIVLGIGSVLDRRHAPGRLKIVLGAGYGGYQPLPALDPSWVIHWVRGPRTAAMLGLDPALGLGDPCMLWPYAASARAAHGDAPHGDAPCGGEVGFMPHFESLARGCWNEVAQAAGVRLIDPRTDPLDIIRAISGCRLLISEAMHGVILADTQRVPWIALEPLAAIHRAKWQDWAGALGLEIHFQAMPASSLYEWAATRRGADRRPARMAIRYFAAPLQSAGLLQRVERAATVLRRLAGLLGQLSAPAALSRCQERMRIAWIGFAIIHGEPAEKTDSEKTFIQRPLRSDPKAAYHRNVSD